MQGQRIPSPQTEEARSDATVLRLLVCDNFGLWTVGEVANAIGDYVEATDALVRLRHAGLVHRLGEFVFASRPALRAVVLTDGLEEGHREEGGAGCD
jgi:hypothetical protein